jgi:hypothetical protein
MAKLNKTPWEVGSLFICSKCGAKFNEPTLAEDVKTEIRKEQKAQDTQTKVRVVVSACLGVCFPEKQTIAFMPVSGTTEVYTTELSRNEIIKDVREIIQKKTS